MILRYFIHAVMVLIVTACSFDKCTAQEDSLKNAVLQKYDKPNIFDSICAELKGMGITEIINQVTYNNYGYNGVVIWRENKLIKGISYHLRNSKVKSKKLKTSLINNSNIDSLLNHDCPDLLNLDVARQVKFSENFIGYFRRCIKGKTDEVYFRYSNYVGAEMTPCLESLKYLMFSL